MRKNVFVILVFLTLFFGCNSHNIDCPEPDRQEILKKAQELVEKEEGVSIVSESLLGNLDTIVLFPGNFSGKGNEYIAMCYSYEEHLPCMSFSHLPPPFETANFLLLKLSCSKGEWTIDWASQENRLKKDNIIDIDADGISEIIFEGSYDCNGGMIYGYYYIAKFIDNKLVNIYENEPIDKIALLPNPNLEVSDGDVVRMDLVVQLLDVDNDGVKELLEKTKTIIYEGGETQKEILDKAIINLHEDTLIFKDNKFVSKNK